jgi:hypothetical protein
MGAALLFALAFGNLGSDGGVVDQVAPSVVIIPPDAPEAPPPVLTVTLPDAGVEEQVIILIPPKKAPPPPPEPPKQLTVVFAPEPRPRVEWGQAGLEMAIGTGVNIVGSGALLAVSLIPITVATFFNAPSVGDGFIRGFALAGAVALPLATTIAIERTKAGSRHYLLEGMGWWATYGSGVGLQLISAVITLAVSNVNNLFSPHLLVFALLTPVTQTVVANYFATPRDPSAPLEATLRRPVLDVAGRPVPTVTVLSGSF